MSSPLGKRSCFESEEVPTKRRRVESDSSPNYLSSQEEKEFYTELESVIEDNLIVPLDNVQEATSSIWTENNFSELNGELLLPWVLSIEERILLANMWILSREKNHEPFELYDFAKTRDFPD